MDSPRSNGDEVWGDVPDFDFSSRERLPAPSHATAKYAKPKRPTTIITPGAAIIQGESHLTHVSGAHTGTVVPEMKCTHDWCVLCSNVVGFQPAKKAK